MSNVYLFVDLYFEVQFMDFDRCFVEVKLLNFLCLIEQIFFLDDGLIEYKIKSFGFLYFVDFIKNSILDVILILKLKDIMNVYFKLFFDVILVGNLFFCIY